MTDIKLSDLSTEDLKKLLVQCKDEQSTYGNLQLAKKIQLNSAYGALGSQFFRFFDVRLAESITMSAQLAIQWILEDLNRFLNKLCKTTDVDYIIASDTDSVYLHMEALVQGMGKDNGDVQETADFIDNVCKKLIDDFIEKSFNRLMQAVSAYDQKMHMKRETIADAGLWVAKKRYILSAIDIEGVRFQEPQIKVTGLEFVRSTTPIFFKSKMKEGYRLALHGTERQYQSYIKSVRDEMYKQHYADLATASGVHDLEKYVDRETIYRKGAPMHTKAALIFNKLIEEKKLGSKYPLIKSGDKMVLLPLKMPNPIRQEVIGFMTTLPQEFGLEKYFDLEEQFEKSFLKPLESMAETMDWSATHKPSLESLFG